MTTPTTKENVFGAQIKVLSMDTYRDGGTLGIKTEVMTEVGPLPIEVRLSKNNDSFKIHNTGGEERMTTKFETQLLEAIDRFIEKDQIKLDSLKHRRERVRKFLGLSTITANPDSNTGFNYQQHKSMDPLGQKIHLWKDGDILIRKSEMENIILGRSLNLENRFILDKGSLRKFENFAIIDEILHPDELFFKIGSVCLSK